MELKLDRLTIQKVLELTEKQREKFDKRIFGGDPMPGELFVYFPGLRVAVL